MRARGVFLRQNRVMAEGAAPDHRQATDDKPEKSNLWKITSVLRWIAALVVAVLALRATGQDACHVSTTTLAGLPTSSLLPRTQTTSTCAGIGVSDLIGYFLVIVVLLLPDAKSIGVGGFTFERLTTKIDEVSKEVGTLSQSLNQTFNIGATALDELRAGLRKQKADLDEVRDSLPDDERTLRELRLVDEIAKRSDDATPPEILHASVLAASLCDEAKRAAAVEVDRSAVVSDADVATAQEAGDVLARLRAVVNRPAADTSSDGPDEDA